MSARHKTQQNALNTINDLREAILSLAESVLIAWVPPTLFISEEHFATKFHGFQAERDSDGRLSIRWRGVRWVTINSGVERTVESVTVGDAMLRQQEEQA